MEAFIFPNLVSAEEELLVSFLEHGASVPLWKGAKRGGIQRFFAYVQKILVMLSDLF